MARTVSPAHFIVCLALAALGFCAPSIADTSGRTATTALAPAQPIDQRIFQPAQPASEREPFGPLLGMPASKLPVPVFSLGKDYLIGPNDLVDVEVFEVDNLKRTARVNAAGAISLPLIGGVVIAGLTTQQAEERIADRYREKYLQNPQISVFVKEFTTERITIEGAVARPGIFPLTGQITLLRALAMAGGFGEIPNKYEVMLFRVNERNVREVAVFDIEKIRSGVAPDPAIKGDDVIVVQRDSKRILLRDSLFKDIVDTINPFSIFAK